MWVVSRNAPALLTAVALVAVGACGGTVTRTGDSEAATGSSESTGGATSGDRGGSAGQGLGGSAAALGGWGAQCGLLEGFNSCGFERALPAVQTVDLLLVLDASGSTSGERGGLGSSLWVSLTEALDVAMTNGRDSIHYGLEIFSYSEDPADPIPYECGDVRRCCEMPDHAEMLVPTIHGDVGVPWILEELRDHEPAGAAAVTAALERAQRYFVDGNPPPNGDVRYVLLVTDGAPICNPYAECDAETCTSNIEELDGCPAEGPSCCDDLPAACLDDVASVEQISALRATGVTTIVMGLPGSERYSAVLERLAEAGGFLQTGGSTSFYALAADGTREDLAVALRDITTRVTQPCRFAAPVALVEPYAVNLLVDCELVPYATPEDPDGGWYWDDLDHPTSVTVHGEVCDRIQGEGVREIHFVFGCGGPPPE